MAHGSHELGNSIRCKYSLTHLSETDHSVNKNHGHLSKPHRSLKVQGERSLYMRRGQSGNQMLNGVRQLMPKGRNNGRRFNSGCLGINLLLLLSLSIETALEITVLTKPILTFEGCHNHWPCTATRLT